MHSGNRAEMASERRAFGMHPSFTYFGTMYVVCVSLDVLKILCTVSQVATQSRIQFILCVDTETSRRI